MKFSRSVLVLLLSAPCTLTVQAGPGTANPYGGRRALVIGIDGLRADALKQQVETGNAPNIAALVANGTVTWNAYAGGRPGTATQQPTISGPGWTSIATGMWTDRHNVVDNSTPAYNQPGVSGSYLVNQAPHFAKRLEEAAPGTFASSIASWSWIEDYLVAAQPSYLDYHAKGSGANYAARDTDVKNKAVAHLGTGDPDLLFLHFDQVDGAGHSYGFSTGAANYMNAIAAVDGLVGEIVTALDTRPERTDEDWIIVLTTDHGGTSGGGHGGQSDGERTIPFIVSGDGIPVGTSTASPGQTAVPPTVIRYFGLSIPASWNLFEDGFITGATFNGVVNAGAVDLSWSMPAAGIPGLTGFEVLRNGSSIGTFSTSRSSFSDPSPLPGTNHYELVLSGTGEATLKRTVLLPNPGERIWDDANADNNWNTTDANWASGAMFESGNDAIFSGSGETVTVDAAGVSPAITKVNSGTYTFTGGSIAGNLAKSGGGSLILSTANAFSATRISGGPNSQTAGALHLESYGALGTGPVAFAHAASMTGLYFLPAAGSGTLENDITLPGGTLTTRFLTDETNVTATLGGVISGGSATHEILIDNDSSSNDVGKIRLTNPANTFTASRLRINRGGLVVTSDAALGNAANDLYLDVTSNLANSGLVLEGSVNLGTGRSITVQSQTVIDTQVTADTFTGPLTLTAQVVKRGSAALRLDAAGSGSGGMNLTEGSITLGNAGGLGTGTLSVASTAAAGFLNTTLLTGSATVSNPIVLPNDSSATNRTVLMNGGSGQQLALGGVISGGGANTTLYLNTSLSGDNAATFSLTGTNTFTGKTQLNRGSLSISSNASLGASSNPLVIDANVGSKLIFSEGMDFTHPVTLGTATVFENNQPVALSTIISGSAALTKSGSGTMSMAGPNTHTGALTVNGGLLLVDGSVAASANPVTVSSSGTLGGIGTINRTVNVSGAIAPGDAIGKLTIPAAVTLGEGSRYVFDLGIWGGGAGNGYDTLDVSTLAITATAAAKLTVHVDAANLTGFDNSPRSFVLATATSPVTGLSASNWQVTTSGASFPGSWNLQAAGNELRLVYSVASGFRAWAAAKSIPEESDGFEQDSDGDGTANGLEYLIGSDPIDPGALGLPVLNATDSHFIFTYTRSTNSAELSPQVQYSDRLDGTWETAIHGENGVTISSEASGENAEIITAAIPKAGADAIFARLKVEDTGE